MIKLYGFPLSGHSHRVELMLSLLGLPTDYILVDLKQGAHKTPDFIGTINSFGQVPAIDDSAMVLADSNAILVYLASKYGNGQWLPSDPVGQAAFSAGSRPLPGNSTRGLRLHAWPWCLVLMSILSLPLPNPTPC